MLEKHRPVLFVVLLTFGTGRLLPAEAAGHVRVLKDHPRLFVPGARFPAIESKVRGKLSPIYLEMVKKDCDAPYDEKRIRFTINNPGYLLSRTLSLLICHRIEKSGAYLEKVRLLADAILEDGEGQTRRVNRVRIQALALIYDWLHETLPQAERERLRSGLVSFYERERGALDGEDDLVSGYSHFTTASLILAAIALCDGTGQFERELDRCLDHWEKHMGVTRWIAADGGHHLGWRYGGAYISRIAWVSEAITTATDRDVFAGEGSWLSQLGYHQVYGLRPDDTYFRVGDTHRYIYMNLDEDLLLYAVFAARYKDPHLAWFAWKALDKSREQRSLAYDSQYVYPLLFLETELERRGPADLPLVRAFTRAGNYIMRTGWGPDDTAVLFRAMPWYHFNHERRDFGSIEIFHKGGLAIHGGTYQAGDRESDYGGSHLRNYAWRTAAHNSITVLDPGERFCAPTGPGHEQCQGDNLWSNDGGQKIRSRLHDDVPVPAYQPRDLKDIQDECFAQGLVLAYEDRPELTYILADGTRAYRRDKLKLFHRSLVFLKKVNGWKHPVIVVFDRVVSTNPEFKKTWNLHTMQIPRLEGQTFVIENACRIRFGGDLKAKPGDYWCQYSGKLYSETLLPKDAELSFVGGEGKEFWVNGKNYPTNLREVDCITEPGIGRIEVSPSRPALEDVFLHALFPAELSDGAPRPPARVIESGGGSALRVGNHILVFRNAGAGTALTYALEQDGPLLHSMLQLEQGKTYKVLRDGSLLRREGASAEGVLVFASDRGGAFHVVPE